MDEGAIREAIRLIAAGRVSRREVVRALAALGLTPPALSALLGPAGAAPPEPGGAVSRRDGDGVLRILFWQAPTLLNAHLAGGRQDLAAARIFYEPLASFDAEARLVPVLAAEVPTVENGGVAPDRTWVRWRLKRGVVWHDGRPFSADDLVFTWEYAAEVGIGRYRDITRVEKLGDHAVRVVFRDPMPFWAEPFCGGGTGQILPRHVFGTYRATRAREAPANLQPTGTGPFRCLEFRPGDVIRAERNRHYHVAGQPAFAALEVKGGGDAVSAARAVLQTGDYDYALNLAVDHEVLQRLEVAGKGRIVPIFSTLVENIRLNPVDFQQETAQFPQSDEKPHPVLTDRAVRSALGRLVDRAQIATEFYGRFGHPTANMLVGPPVYVSSNTRWAFDPAEASRILDDAGWRRGSDGVRTRDGRRLALLFRASANPVQQKIQSVVKQACARAGIELELSAVIASVLFGSDQANPNTYWRFRTDLQLVSQATGPDPLLGMERFTSWEVPSTVNGGIGGNVSRWRSDEYDRLWRAARYEIDPVKRAAYLIRMNDVVIESGLVIPIVRRDEIGAVSRSLAATFSPWDSPLSTLAAWRRH